MKTFTVTDEEFAYMQECIECVAGDERQPEMLIRVRKIMGLDTLVDVSQRVREIRKSKRKG